MRSLVILVPAILFLSCDKPDNHSHRQNHRHTDEDDRYTVGLLTRLLPDMTYNVFGGTLNPTLLLYSVDVSNYSSCFE